MGKRALIATLASLMVIGRLTVDFVEPVSRADPFASFWQNRYFDRAAQGPFSSPVGQYRLAELQEDESYITYRSEPDPNELEKAKEEEKEKLERSWDMLRNMVIVPHPAGPYAPPRPHRPPCR